MSNFLLPMIFGYSHYQWWMQDFLKGGSITILRAKHVRKLEKPHPLLAPCSDKLLALPLNLFLIENPAKPS